MATHFNADVLKQALAALVPSFPHARLCVALSGGLDSMALLHAARELARDEPGLALRALHVDHGLQPESQAWATRCGSVCESLGVPLALVRLELAVERGASIEAEARSARYAALAEALGEGEFLLTAQHADDQLETVLLQLLRGAGVAGLAAMPASAALGRGRLLRPLLGATRDALEAYATAARLAWIEDPMNADARYDRAWLRREVLPVVTRRFPAAAHTVSRSARHLAEAQALLDALADSDLAPLCDDGRLQVSGLAAMPRARQANVLRRWLVSRGLGVPSAARLGAVLDDVLPARDDAVPVVSWATGEVRRYRGRLYAMAPLGPEPSPGWHGVLEPGVALQLPDGLGALSLEPAVGEGIAAAAVNGPLTVRFRTGGEALRAQGQALAKPLKQWLQEAGVETWLRPRLPLIYSGSVLVAVADRWIVAEAAASPGTDGLRPRWVRPDRAPPRAPP